MITYDTVHFLKTCYPGKETVLVTGDLSTRFTKTLFLASGVALLSGCTTFGVDNQTWATLSPQEKQIAMKSYYRSQAQQQAEQAKVDQINAKNAPINNAISALSNAAGNTHQQCITDDFGSTVCGYNCYKDDFGNAH